jgi:gluconokinase
LVEKVKEGASDTDSLEWAFATGRMPREEEIAIWNEFMRKRGWNDDVTETLDRRKRESNLSQREDIQTMFDYIDADEGRSLTSEQGVSAT